MTPVLVPESGYELQFMDPAFLCAGGSLGTLSGPSVSCRLGAGICLFAAFALLPSMEGCGQVRGGGISSPRTSLPRCRAYLHAWDNVPDPNFIGSGRCVESVQRDNERVLPCLICLRPSSGINMPSQPTADKCPSYRQPAMLGLALRWPGLKSEHLPDEHVTRH